jgi:hypothetical protein
MVPELEGPDKPPFETPPTWDWELCSTGVGTRSSGDSAPDFKKDEESSLREN